MIPSQDETEPMIEAAEQNVISDREEALQGEVSALLEKHNDLEKSVATTIPSQDEAEPMIEAAEQNVISDREEALQRELSALLEKHSDLEKSVARINGSVTWINGILQEHPVFIQKYDDSGKNHLQNDRSLENEAESIGIAIPEESSKEPVANPRSLFFKEDSEKSYRKQQEMEDSLEHDTFTMMMVHPPTVAVGCLGCRVISRAWFLGIFVFALQISLGVMIIIDQGAYGGSRIEGQTFANVPIRVQLSVSVAQFITLILCPLVQPESLVAIKTMIMLRPNGEARWEEAINETGSNNNISLWICRIFFPNMLKLLQGSLIIYTTWIVIVQSEDVISLLIDFTALFVISSIDDIFFTVASHGYLGKTLAEISLKSKHITIEQRNDNAKNFYNLRMLLLVIFMGSGLTGWGLIISWQYDGRIAAQKYPACTDVVFSRIGDFICDYDESNYNTNECGWDGGDCVVEGYPGCHVIPSNVGNGICDGGSYNRENCGFDGGDCVVKDYRKCRVDKPEKINDGICDGGDYNVEPCGWDGGDCTAFRKKYPSCQVSKPKKIGDGKCDGEEYNTESCDWDGGDCEKKAIFESEP